MPGLLPELVERAHRPEPGGREHRDAIADALDDVEQVGRVEDRSALVRPAAKDRLEHRRARRVETAEGFVQHEELGPREERAGQGRLLPHPAGERADGIVDPSRELEVLEQADGLGLRPRVVVPVQAAHQHQVLARREVRVERCAVGDVAQVPARGEGIHADVLSRDLDAPRCGLQQTGEDADRGRLRAGPDEAEHLAAAHLEDRSTASTSPNRRVTASRRAEGAPASLTGGSPRDPRGGRRRSLREGLDDLVALGLRRRFARPCR